MPHTQEEAAGAAYAPERPPAHPGAGREGKAAEGSRRGAPCACAANSCHLVRNKSSKDPKTLREGRTFILFSREASGPLPAAQVTASWCGQSGKGDGLGGSSQDSGTGLCAPQCTAVRWEGRGGRDSPFWTPPGSGARRSVSSEPKRGGAALDCHARVVCGSEQPDCGRPRGGLACAPSGPP